MSDKFTRLGAAEGDVFYATTAGSSKSIESLEDNIDANLLAFVGQDKTSGSVSSSNSETVIGQVTVSANTVNSNLLIVVSISHTPAASNDTGTFKIRVGTAGTTADSQVGSDYVIRAPNTGGAQAIMGGCLTVVAIGGSDFTKTNTNYVTVTGTNSSTSGSQSSTCASLIVFGA